MINLNEIQVIDLTMPFNKEVKGFDFRITKKLKEHGWNARHLSFYSHCGTHMDAPFHFGVSKDGIDSYPVDRFVGKAWIIDIAVDTTQQLIPANVVRPVEGEFRSGDSLLIRTGWCKKFGSKSYRDELPRIGEDLARWCVQHDVNMLGVEAPSVADVNNLDEVTLIHEILLGGDIIIIEGLCNLHLLHSNPVTLIALPLKISGSDGSPARVIALAKKNV